MRTLVDIPAPQLEALTEIGRRKGVSRAQVIRTALDHYLAQDRVGGRGGGFAEFQGIWKTGEDGGAYQRRMREEW